MSKLSEEQKHVAFTELLGDRVDLMSNLWNEPTSSHTYERRKSRGIGCS